MSSRRSIFLRPGLVLATMLVIIMALIGVLAEAKLLSAFATSVSIDIMQLIGLGLAMAVIMGYAGYVSFGHSVFVGLGSFMTAYTVTVLARNITENLVKLTASGSHTSLSGIALLFVLSLIMSSIITAILAASVGAAVLRLRGAFFAIATIGLDYTVWYAVKYIIKVSIHVPEAIASTIFIPNIGLTDTTIYWMSFVAFVISLYVAYWVKNSRLGYGLAAIREDEDAAEVMGVPTFKYKVIAFVIAAVLAGIWGTTIAFRESFKADDQFSLMYSIIMLLENAIGGVGTYMGPIVGALVYYPLKYFTETKAAQLALVILGALIVIIVSFFPVGIVGGLRLKSKKLRRILE